MTWNLFIDDERSPSDVTWAPWVPFQVWFIARNQCDVLDLIWAKGFPLVISFDHDLGEHQPTGYDITKMLCKMDMEKKVFPEGFKFYVHSKNPVGVQNISHYLTNYLKLRE